jgi:hypothetical protein
MNMPVDWNKPHLRCPPLTNPLKWERMNPWQQLATWREYNERTLKKEVNNKGKAPKNPVRLYAVRMTSLV